MDVNFNFNGNITGGNNNFIGSVETLIQNFNNSEITEPNLLKELIHACIELQGRSKQLAQDENSRNNFIAHELNHKGFIAKDQPNWGTSASGKSAGEIDIKIENKKGETITICEGFILSSCDTTVIDKHIIKIFNYDQTGYENNYFLIYSEAKDYLNLWTNYISHLPSISYPHKFIDFKDITTELKSPAEIKIGIAQHERNGQKINLYHILINLNK